MLALTFTQPPIAEVLRGSTRADSHQEKNAYPHCLSTRWRGPDVHHPNTKHIRDNTGSSWIVTPFYQQFIADNPNMDTHVSSLHITKFLAHFPSLLWMEDWLWSIVWYLIPSSCQLFLPCDLTSTLLRLPANTGWGLKERDHSEFKGQGPFTCNSTYFVPLSTSFDFLEK